MFEYLTSTNHLSALALHQLQSGTLRRLGVADRTGRAVSVHGTMAAPFDPAKGLECAALSLLGAQYVDGQWLSVDAELKRLETSDCGARACTISAGCFESHVTLSLPDNPPFKLPPLPPGASAPQRYTDVHRFVLTPSVRTSINENLYQEAIAQRDANVGERRSNVGGFHSVEEEWSGGGSSAAWYGKLHNVVLEALRALPASANNEIAPVANVKDVATPKVSGWLNVSAPSAFNSLHDHGEALWSAVYYVADGVPEGVSDLSGVVAEDCYAGCLLLRTQLIPFTHNYGFLPISPRPGAAPRSCVSHRRLLHRANAHMLITHSRLRTGL